MATCVRCKREIDSSIKYCPYCGAKQNMFIDASQVVNKNIIDDHKFDAKKDVVKTPRVIIDNSEAATPHIIQDGEVKKIITPVEELPTLELKEADASDYTDQIQYALFDDVSARLEKASALQKEIEEQEVEEPKEVVIEEKIQSYDKEITPEEKKSIRLNAFATISYLLIGLALFFFTIFPYVKDQESPYFIANIVKDSFTNISTFLTWSEKQYSALFGVFWIAVSLIFFILFIISWLTKPRPRNLSLEKYHLFGISLALLAKVLFYSACIDIYTSDNTLQIFLYVSFGLIMLTLFINMIVSLADPYTLSFRVGFLRYDLENKEMLPKLSGMNKGLAKRKIAYILIAGLLLYYVFLITKTNTLYENFHDLFDRYVDFYASVSDPEKKISNWLITNFDKVMEWYDNYIHVYFELIHFVALTIVATCVVSKEFTYKKKDAVIHKISSLIFIVCIVCFTLGIIGDLLVFLPLFDGNEEFIVADELKYALFQELGIFALSLIILVFERVTNKTIERNQKSIYKLKE